MVGQELMERGSSMEDAFDVNRAPTTMPAGPQQVIIDDRPNGAQKIAVARTKSIVLREIKTLAAAAGEGFYYRWPVKNKDGSTDWVEGPSVKCTNAVAREYGNCFVQVRAIDQGQHWMISARFLDLETGFALERPFQQRKGQNIGGKMDKDRATDIVFQIGVSKATRNVVANALSEFVDYAFEEAKAGIVAKVGKNLDQYRKRVNDRLQELKVPVDRVERQLGKTIDKWLAPDVARVIAEVQSVNDGMADADEMWPSQEAGAPRPTEGGERQDDDRSRSQAAKTETAKPQPEQKKEPEKQPAAAQVQAEAQVQEADEARDQVSAAIASAAKADGPTLEQIDDQTSSYCDKAGREDQRKRWNEAYMTRKNEIRSGHKGPSALEPAAAAPQATAEQALKDWFDDAKKELAEAKTTTDVDDLEEKVAAELTGNEAMEDEWKNLCAQRYRQIAKARR